MVVGIAVEDVDKRDRSHDLGHACEMNYTSLIGGTRESIEPGVVSASEMDVAVTSLL